MQKTIQYHDYICQKNSTHPQKLDATIIVFHGFGADYNDLAPLKDYLTPINRNIRWIFPNGVLQVPLGPMMNGRAWWPLSLQSLPGDWTDVSPPQIDELRERIIHFIKSLNTPIENIILGGFSQGAMLAAEVYTHLQPAPLGLISLSGTLIRKSQWANGLKNHKGRKIFLSHGEQDSVLPSGGTQKLIQLLKQNELDCDFVSFRGGHEIPLNVIERVQKYIEKLT